MKTCWIALCLCAAAALLLQSVNGRRGQDLHCGACRALVDEMEWEISQIDPKKTIQAGSFRINPDGSQSIRECSVMLAGNAGACPESSLLEVMERVCEKMSEYAEKQDPGSQRTVYERVVSRDGKKMDLSGSRFDTRAAASLKFTCEGIVEKYEDELIEFFSHETENVKDKLCSKRTDLCDHALHIPHDEL
ncbi:UNVERIFIED_CONTAM: hypothetical protein FKN15_045969 [Acipenser sinensis]